MKKWLLASRTLTRRPGFAAAAILILALGIGANTAVFSMVDAVLFRPLPYQRPERLVRLWESKPSEGKERFDIAPANFLDWQKRARSFDELALFYADSNRTVLGTADGSLQVRDASVSPNCFALAGVKSRAIN